MNRILAICNSLNLEVLNGGNIFLRFLVQKLTMVRFASKHIWMSLPFHVNILIFSNNSTKTI